MQSLLLAENVHQGEFVQQGLQFENLPTQLFTLREPLDHLFANPNTFDNILLLVNNHQRLPYFFNWFQSFAVKFPVTLLAQQYDPVFDEFIKKKYINHFFTRPFPFRTIAMELRVMLYQRTEQSSCQILKMRDLELRRDSHEVVWKGQKIDLKNKEFILLEFLMLNHGKLLSRETILENVWDRNANIFTNTVDVHINKLRKKIDYQIRDTFIHTIPCSGYIFS